MWESMTEAEQRVWLNLAKAIWTTENEKTIPDRSDEKALDEAWQSAKHTEMRKALAVKRKLENKGIVLVSK